MTPSDVWLEPSPSGCSWRRRRRFVAAAVDPPGLPSVGRIGRKRGRLFDKIGSIPSDSAEVFMNASSIQSAARANRGIGAMFFSAFGTAWLSWGDLVARGRRDWTLLPIIAVGGALFAAAWRCFRANKGGRGAIGTTPRARRIARVFHLVNAGQWVLIFVLANVLNNTGLGHWVVPMIIAVVGAHFLPLAWVMSYRPHYVSGIALLTLAAVYPFAMSAGPFSAAGQLGAGLILWASAAYGLTAGGRADEADVSEAQVA